MDDNAFLDQFNACVYDCTEGYIKNKKLRKCQECLYQRNPDYSLVCVLDCESNQYADLKTRQCIKCINNCTKCTSLTYCTECQQGLSFENEKQEKCKQCESNEYANDNNQCQACTFINCLQCNKDICTKCMHEYKIEKDTGECKYDTRYESYECKGVNKLDNSCEEEIKFIDKSDLVMKSSQYAAVGLQLAGSLTVGTGSFIGYTFQMQQIIGNNLFYKKKVKTLSLGPTFYEQNYQMNILSMIPNPYSYIPSYEKYINGKDDKPSASQNTKSLLSNNENNYLNEKRILSNQLTSNGLSSLQSQDLSKSFLDTFIIYFTFMLLLGLVILICNQFDPKKSQFFDMVHEKKYSVLIQIQMIFSNYVYIAMFKSLQELEYSSMKPLDYISITVQLIYILAYLFFAVSLLLKIQNYDRKNEDLQEVKVYMSLIKNILTDVSLNKYFWFFFELRKIFTIFIIFFIPNTIVSCIFLMALNSFFVFFHLFKKPFFILNEQRYYYTLEILNLINNISLAIFLITDYKIMAWLTLLTLVLINIVILLFTVFSLSRTIYIKFFQKRFIISTSNQTDIDYKWKEIHKKNSGIKAIKFTKTKSFRNSSPIKSLERSTLNDSMNISNVTSLNDYPVELNELSIKWSMNPIFTRHIALKEFPKEDQSQSSSQQYLEAQQQ